MKKGIRTAVALGLTLVPFVSACVLPLERRTDSTAPVHRIAGSPDDFADFTSLASSSPCIPPPATPQGFAEYKPFILPDGYSQRIVSTELADLVGIAADRFDMLTLNETGADAGRYLYRSHEVESNGAITIVDLETGDNRVLTQSQGYRNLDGLAWTPWETLLFGEESAAGRVFEYFPESGDVVPRPYLGLRRHEGIRLDSRGYVYGISEQQQGAVFRFVPDRPGDLASGELYALRADGSGRTGSARWVPLDIGPDSPHGFDSNGAALAAGATTWDRPEDVEIARSIPEDSESLEVLYVAVTSEQRVLRIDLEEEVVKVSDFVVAGANAPLAFEHPDNLAVDAAGNLFIAEDSAPGDLWIAIPRKGDGESASVVARFASLSDCAAEPSGIYFDLEGRTLYVNVQHAGGRLQNDLTVAITRNR